MCSRIQFVSTCFVYTPPLFFVVVVVVVAFVVELLSLLSFTEQLSFDSINLFVVLTKHTLTHSHTYRQKRNKMKQRIIIKIHVFMLNKSGYLCITDTYMCNRFLFFGTSVSNRNRNLCIWWFLIEIKWMFVAFLWSDFIQCFYHKYSIAMIP